MAVHIRRREFIVTLGGAALHGPRPARAQQGGHARRVGVLMGLQETDPFTMGYVRALREGLQELGWTDGRNIEFTYRYAAGDPEKARRFAEELAEMPLDLIVGHTTPVAAALHQATRNLPVVFVSISDPAADGFVASMARPGDNMTGFTNYEFAMGAKWLEILKQLVPQTTHVSLLLNPDTGSYYTEYLRSVQGAASSYSVRATLTAVHNPGEIESALVALAGEPGGGLIVLPSAPITAHIESIIGLAARYRMPSWVASLPMGSSSMIFSGGRPAMWIASSRERCRPSCRCRRRQNMSSWSISRPPVRLASLCRRRCSHWLTRS